MKILYLAVHFIYIIAWLVASSFTKAAITDMDLEPADSDQYDAAAGSDEEGEMDNEPATAAEDGSS